jgi:DNA-binding MarR family transcriptional regulator
MERVDSSLIALRQIMLATESFSKKLAQSVGLTAPQLRVLQIVAKADQCTATQIAKQTRITQATVTSLIDKLVKKEFVIRQRSTTDKRQTIIQLTELGRQAIESAPDPLQQKFVSKFSSLEDWEQASLISALERVASMLDAEDIKAAPVLDAGKIDED